jgi:hypothetical protein
MGILVRFGTSKGPTELTLMSNARAPNTVMPVIVEATVPRNAPEPTIDK